MATLTRKEMEQVITDGGSVLHEGVLHTHVQTLPDEADLAVGDETRMQEARDALDRQMASLAAQRAKLETPSDTTTDGRQKKATKADPPVSTPAAKDSNNTQPGAA